MRGLDKEKKTYMRKIYTLISTIAILLFVFQIGLKAQPIGSQIKIGTDSQISYWNGVDTWIPIAAGLPGQNLQFTAGVPTWVNNLNGITTTIATSITSTTAVSGGNILNDGGATITAYGVCWSTLTNPTVALTTKTTENTGIVNFTSNITGLLAGTTYYVRAYATNSAGTVYGNELSFTTLAPVTTVIDYDGNVYDFISIGTQVWMKQNLKTTHYKDGTVIPNVTINASWASITGAYCDISNNPSNSATYGRLYNWYTVNTGNLCPLGWHVPSDADWTSLINFLGNEGIAGAKLKEAGLAHWISPNTAATNETGFTALPAGYRSGSGSYYMFGNMGYWWSSTESSSTYAWVRLMYNDAGNVAKIDNHKAGGLSVRCIRD